MKLFVDTANLEELEACLKRGFPSGVTTNPAILSKERHCDFRDHINDMIWLLLKYDCKIPLSKRAGPLVPGSFRTSRPTFWPN